MELGWTTAMTLEHHWPRQVVGKGCPAQGEGPCRPSRVVAQDSSFDPGGGRVGRKGAQGEDVAVITLLSPFSFRILTCW